MNRRPLREEKAVQYAYGKAIPASVFQYDDAQLSVRASRAIQVNRDQNFDQNKVSVVARLKFGKVNSFKLQGVINVFSL